MVNAYQIRTYFPTHTLSSFMAIDGTGNLLTQCVILELPWRDNQPEISCIFEGIYLVKERRTDKFGRHYHIQNVQDRSYILQHPGNFTRQIRGCQLPGEKFKHLNADGIPDIINTRAMLDKLLSCMGKEYTLHIMSVSPPAFPHQVKPNQFWIDKLTNTTAP